MNKYIEAYEKYISGEKPKTYLDSEETLQRIKIQVTINNEQNEYLGVVAENLDTNELFFISNDELYYYIEGDGYIEEPMLHGKISIQRPVMKEKNKVYFFYTTMLVKVVEKQKRKFLCNDKVIIRSEPDNVCIYTVLYYSEDSDKIQITAKRHNTDDTRTIDISEIRFIPRNIFSKMCEQYRNKVSAIEDAIMYLYANNNEASRQEIREILDIQAECIYTPNEYGRYEDYAEEKKIADYYITNNMSIPREIEGRLIRARLELEKVDIIEELDYINMNKTKVDAKKLAYTLTEEDIKEAIEQGEFESELGIFDVFDGGQNI